jgi:hypothetical protein
MLGPRSLFSPNCYKTGSTVSDTVVTVIIWRRSCPTLTRSAIASAVVSCIVISGVVRAAPTTVTQGLGSGAASSMMPATIVVRIMIRWIIHTATLHPV